MPPRRSPHDLGRRARRQAVRIHQLGAFASPRADARARAPPRRCPSRATRRRSPTPATRWRGSRAAAAARVHQRRVRHPASRARHLSRAGARARRVARRRGQLRCIGQAARQRRRPAAQPARRPDGRARRARLRRPRRAVRRRHAARADPRVPPDVLVKGGDYTAATTAGAAEVIADGGRFVAIPFRPSARPRRSSQRIRR